MAKTGIHFKPCNVGSVEAHNSRTKGYLEGVQRSGRELYFFQDLTHTNRSYENPRYKGKSCAEIFELQKARYKDLVGQEPNTKDRTVISKKTGKERVISGWSPIREGVAPIKENTKLEDFKPFIEWANSNGLNVIRIDLHFDEGYEDEENKRKMNRHAHIVVDWMDWSTGKTAKLNAAKMSEAQDIIAEALGMERGESKIDTGKEHLSPTEQKEKKAEEHYKELLKKIEELMNVKTGLVAKIEDSWKYKSAAEEGEKKIKQILARFERFRKEYEELVGNLKKKLSEAEKEANRAKNEASSLRETNNKQYDEIYKLKAVVRHWKDKYEDLTTGKELSKGKGFKI